MRRSLIVCGLGYVALSFVAILSLAGLSDSLLAPWRFQRPEDPGLPPWTLAAPTAARVSLVDSLLLGVVSLLAFKRDRGIEGVMAGGIVVMVLIQTLLTIFVIMAGMLPMVVTIVAAGRGVGGAD